jgi:gluconolactonase
MPGDIMRKWTADGGIVTFRQPCNMTNGNTYDSEGRLLSCEHATSRVTRTEHDGSITVLATTYNALTLNSPNDIVVRRDGTIWFSDPTFGRMPYYGLPREQEHDFQGVYRVNPDGSGLTLLVDDFAQPNGLCFSLDERRLFVNDTDRSHIRVFDVGADGSLTGGGIWAPVVGDGPGAPDGMKVDRDGNLYCCGPGGLHVFSPEGHLLGVIETPEVVANFTWGDPDMRSLFLTASTSLYRTRTRTPGIPPF